MNSFPSAVALPGGERVFVLGIVRLLGCRSHSPVSDEESESSPVPSSLLPDSQLPGFADRQLTRPKRPRHPESILSTSRSCSSPTRRRASHRRHCRTCNCRSSDHMFRTQPDNCQAAGTASEDTSIRRSTNHTSQARPGMCRVTHKSWKNTNTCRCQNHKCLGPIDTCWATGM